MARPRNARLRRRVDELLDVLDHDVVLITDMRREMAIARHPAGKEMRGFTVIQGGAS